MNGSTSTASTSHCSSSASRCSRVASRGGAESGWITVIGCGSKVTTTDRAPRAGRGHDAGQQVLVPEVDAVEVADRHDGPGDVVEPDLVE